MPKRDLPSELQNLWQQLPTSSGVKHLHEEETQTRDAVAWMSQAWTSLPIPKIRTPKRKPHPFRFVLATAAALLVGALLFLTDIPPQDPEPVAPTLVAAATQTSFAPRLIETSALQTQVLSGKVRLTMLHAQGPPTSTPNTEF